MIFDSRSYPISWFREQYRNGSLEIRPPYQRKPVWTARQKSFLVESILLGLPVPEVYLHEITSSEGTTTYAVVDGQQRIRTILQFVGVVDDAMDDEDYDSFSLDLVDPTSPFFETSFDELGDEDKSKYFGYKLSVRTLEDAADSDVRDMFRRLNRFLTPLNAQELRNATYVGPFMQLVSDLAEDDFWAANGLVTAAQIRRSKDLEFVSELLIGIMHGPQGSRVIDDYYGLYEDYDDEFPGQRAAKARYLKSLETVRSLLPDIKDTRWSNLIDFYSLFVAVGFLVREESALLAQTSELRERVIAFGAEVDLRVGDEEASVSREAAAYSRAVSRGASEKSRRGDRHLLLLTALGFDIGASPA